jgi:6-phosphogluconolactonase
MASKLFVSCATAGRTDVPAVFEIEIDALTQVLTVTHASACGANPSFFTVHKDSGVAVAVNETEAGSLTTFDVNAKLAPIANVPVEASDPCYVAVHPSGQWVLVANYSDVSCKGSISVHHMASRGKLTDPVQVLEHAGYGPHATRQTGPHVHCVVFHPTNPGLVYAVDLGVDTVYHYAFDAATGSLSSAPGVSHLRVASGSGPRHLTFSRCASFAFLTTELDNTLVVASIDPTSGQLSVVQTLPLLPGDADTPLAAASYAADVHVHPCGPFVLASVRGVDVIAVYHVRLWMAPRLYGDSWLMPCSCGCSV